MTKFIYATQYDSVSSNSSLIPVILSVDGIRLIESTNIIISNILKAEEFSNLKKTHPYPAALEGYGTAITYKMSEGNIVTLYLIENFDYFKSHLIT